MRRTFLLLSVVIAACGTLSAATIDFVGLPGNNGDPFSTFSEAGFTVNSKVGSWHVAELFGNPIPDIYCPNCSPGTVEVTGGIFNFSSVDLGEAQPTGFSYEFKGYLGGNLVLDQTGSLTNGVPWTTVASANASTLLDRLDLTINTGGGNDGNIDNIVLGVPEPATLGLLLCGLGALALCRRQVRH
jgi:hypothetical protein